MWATDFDEEIRKRGIENLAQIFRLMFSPFNFLCESAMLNLWSSFLSDERRMNKKI